MNKQALHRLARAARARRTELGLAQGDLAGRGGPSVVVVGQIEREQQANPQALTLARLDRALEWEPGSSAAVLAGGEAAPLPRVTSQGGKAVETDIARPGQARVEQPVGLGLDDEATDAGLTDEQIQAVKTIIRGMKPQP